MNLTALTQGIFVLTLALMQGTLAVAAVDIASKPLFVTAGVEPNIIAGIDDSGSMDSEVLMPANDGAFWWNTSTDSFVGLDNTDSAALGVLNYNRAGGASGTWKKTTYLFPNGTGTGNRVYSDATNDHFAVPPFIQFAFARSSAYNGMYYDPDQTYVPWPSAGGYTFGNVPPAAAPSDPTRGSSTFDLTRVHRDTANNNRFELQTGMVLPAGTVTFNGTSWVTTASDTERTAGPSDIGVEYYPATYYVPVTTGLTYTVRDVASGNVFTGNCAAPEPAHYLIFERNPSELTGVDALAYDGGCLEKVEIIDDGRTFDSGRSYTDEMQNFANWWSYSRKRHLAARSGIGQAFETTTGVRMGALTLNSRSLRGMYSLSDAAERDSFFKYIYERGGNGGGTPNRQTLDFIGGQFDNNSSVITESCQQNFAMIFTDGFSNVNTGSGSGNADGSMGVPFQDTHSNTIADIAAKYYNKTLGASTLASGRVPVPTECALATPPLSADCNDDPHMVTYGITLGAQGSIFGQTHFDVEDAHSNPPAWQNPTQTRNPVQVDDLYHAAVNSRGEMLNAQNADQLRQVLSGALLDIVDRTSQSGTSSSTSAAILQEDTLLYSVAFRSDDWTGNLIAQEVSTVDGSLTAQAWNAESILETRSTSSRNLLTFDGAAGADLAYANLSQAQKDALDTDLSDVNDGRGTERVAWLRGDNVSGMRNRAASASSDLRLIGDIVNSTPLYVGTPNRGYSSLPTEFSPGTYGTFRSSIGTRKNMMAVGANDGFLHVFDADTGVELFAYMPSELLEPAIGHDYAQASLLTDPNYAHQFFVDGSASVNDVLINSAWKTVLVGSMGVGGRSIFAIDVTDPNSVDAADVLWEFSDPDLGYGVTDVQILPMQNGGFAAVFGNGYNSDNDKAVLFVVDIADGTLLAKLDTGAGSSADPNGLAAPVASSFPQLNFVTQYLYAGDLHGNLWRFELTDDNPSGWDRSQNVDKLFEATDANGDRQPITVQPRLSLNPKRSGELIINFGTGSFFRDQDNSLANPQVQTLYGIREALGNTTITRGDLLEQTILWQDTVVALGEPRIVRQLSNNNYDTSNNNSEEDGWYLDLVYDGNNVGERVISSVTFPSGNRRERVRFTSMTPSNDPCSAGRVGFIFDMDLFTGGATDFSVFDLNDDGFFNVDDLVDLKMVNAISGGKGEQLTIIRNQEGGGDFFYDGSGGRIGNGTGPEGLATGDPLGRQSWQQLR